MSWLGTHYACSSAGEETGLGFAGHVEAHKALFPGNDVLRSQVSVNPACAVSSTPSRGSMIIQFCFSIKNKCDGLQLDKWTEDFEAEEDRRKREAAAALAEEGWTVVKRRGVCQT